MSLTQRQMACFERNSQFLNEVAAALLPIAASMKAAALVVQNTPESSDVQRTFATIREKIADQILNEQGISLQQPTGVIIPMNTGTATGGSTAMKYLVQQMLLRPTWTLTPDQWASDETAARAAIQAEMTDMLTVLTAIPSQS